MASSSIFTDDTQLGSDAGVASTARAPRLLPGSMIAHYQVLGQLGAGGMGIVYRARDQRLGREVALKLKPPSAEGQTSCRLLCSLLGREAQVMASLSHPNLVSIYEVGEFRSCIFLALELVDGTTLREWAPTQTVAERCRALVAAGTGLVAAHRAGVVHRDFKPENVLVSSTGAVKVADFGLARSKAQILAWGVACGGCGGDDANTELAADAGNAAGTPRYMPIQQLDGVPGDELSDQFAFAVSAWEVLWGTYPFAARSVGELKRAIVSGPERPPADADPRLVSALVRGLAATPQDRHPSLESLLAAAFS